MPVILIPNQLVKLYKTTDFNTRNKKLTLDYRQYCQIVKDEQTTMFQVRVTEEGSQLLTNPEFTSDINNWTQNLPVWQWSAGQAQAIIGSSGLTQLSQTVSLSANTSYALEVDIALFAGSQNVFLNLMAINGVINAIQISRSEYGTTPGKFTLYFYTDSYTHHIIRLLAVGDENDLVYVNSVTLYKLTTPVVTLETCDGDLVKTIPVYARGLDRITYAIEWYGLDEDCYRVCLPETDDTNLNYLDKALALATEGDELIELEDGSGYIKWFG